jgi:hypothetical protein
MIKSTTSFKIPMELFLEIQLFLNSIEYWMLLIAAKKLFEEIRFSTRMIKLNKPDTSRFLEEPDYLRLILDKVQSPGRQLSLRVDRENLWVEDFFPVNEIRVNSYLKGVSPNWEQLFSLASKLDLSLSDHISELPFFPNLRSLKVQEFSKLSILNSLSHLKKLCIEDCWTLKDVNCLQPLEDLTIQSSTVTDVSHLGNIRALTLIKCYELKDISKLTNNYRLRILMCDAITSVPSVFNSTILTIDAKLLKNKRPSNFPPLKRFNIFRGQLDSLNSFPVCNLFSLEISNIGGFKTLSPEMRTIPVVTLDHCRDLEDISDLGENKYVKIDSCLKITSFSSLKNVPNVVIKSCCGFSDGKDVENVRHLTIYNYEDLTGLSSLKNIQHLVLFGSFGGVVEGIWSIPVLEVTSLFAMKYFPHVELNNEKIRISGASSFPSEIAQSCRNYDMSRYNYQIILFRKREELL